MSSPTAAGQPTLGRYVLLREIARSNDVVWEGMDPRMNRRVAVKELALAPSLTGTARRDRIERFYREARAAGAMNHPNIVTIHEVGEDHGRYFIAMEYLEGQTLRDRLSVGGAMGISEAVAVVMALCDALDYAHTRGVIHRDIKPDNVHLLPGARVKLTDFGIARIQHEDQLTVAGQVFGTPSYMAPEQVLGRPVDARTDLFSLGVMLYEMLAGRKPFTGDSVATITYRIVNEATPPITATGTGSPALEVVIQRATAKDPNLRYGSAAEMKSALETALADHRTGNFRAAPPQPLTGYGSPPAMTAQYGTQTQWGIAPGYAAQPPPVIATTPPPVYYPPAPERARNTSRVAAAIGAAVAIGLCFVLLTVGVGRALKNATMEQGVNAEQQHLAAAQTNYNSGQFAQSAQQAMQVRESTRSDRTRADAARTEAYSYLALGYAARNEDRFDDAQKWYDLAKQLLPDDPNVKDHLAKFADAKRVRSLATGGTLPAVNGPMPGAAPTPTPAPAFGPTPTPPAQINTQQFNNTNSSNAQSAQQLYDEGLQLQSHGDTNGARAKWQAAVTIGPGSPAAAAANDALTKTAPSF